MFPANHFHFPQDGSRSQADPNYFKSVDRDIQKNGPDGRGKYKPGKERNIIQVLVS
jgi:hypothetical protein